MGKKFFYGWVIVGVALLTSLAISGSRMSFGPSFKPILEDFGTTRGLVSVAMSINQLFYGLAGPVTGWLTDRYGAKNVVLLSAGITLAGLLWTSFASDLWMLYVAYGVLAGFGFSGTTTIPFSALVTRWFRRRSGLALGLFTAGTPIGHMIIVPISTAILLAFNWRYAYVFLSAVIALIVLPLTWRLVRQDPADMGLLPDGDEVAPQFPSSGPAPLEGAVSPGQTLAQAVNTKPYWLLCAGWFTCGFSGFLVVTHLVPFATDVGMDPMQAATVLSLMGVFSAIGTLGICAVSDRTGCKNPLAAIYLSRFLAFPLLLTSIAAHNYVFIYLFVIIMGLGQLATFPLASVITREIYGQRSMGVILGTILLSHQVGAAAGVYLGGVIFDTAGSYDAAFMIAAVLSLIAAAVTLFIKEERGPALVPALARME